jgi:hypothetical protein
MSRRIAYWVFTTAAVLIAAPANAQRGIEPPAANQQAEPLVPQNGRDARTKPNNAPPRSTVNPAPRRSQAVQRAYGPAAIAADSRRRPIIVSGPVSGEGPADAVVIGVPASVYADDGVVAAYPDPSWKLCQISEPGIAIRYYRCGPYSYHPYGVHGYRPYGTYGYAPSAPARVVVPSARIIEVDPED